MEKEKEPEKQEMEGEKATTKTSDSLIALLDKMALEEEQENTASSEEDKGERDFLDDELDRMLDEQSRAIEDELQRQLDEQIQQELDRQWEEYYQQHEQEMYHDNHPEDYLHEWTPQFVAVEERPSSPTIDQINANIQKVVDQYRANHSPHKSSSSS